nr:endothelial lipase [Vicugna pacos]
MRNSVLLLCLWRACCCFAAGGPTPLGPEGWPQGNVHLILLPPPQLLFCARSPLSCPPFFNQEEYLLNVPFSLQMSGMFESWLHKLMSALQTREKGANIVVVDWLPLAHQLYRDVVNNTREVGHSIAKMLNWLQGQDDFSLRNVHLIGYSLGAHVAGYAGNFVKGTVGRITAIAEGVKCEHEQAVHLFVDSLVNQDKPSFAFQCTDSNRFKKGICLSCRKNRCNSIGYNAKKTRNKRNSKMYLKTRAGMPFRGNLGPRPCRPGGGALSFFLLLTIAEGVKCEHERAVHLFVDSLVNQDKPSFAFQCTDSNRFKKGICLSCRKNRCNSIGYNAKKTRNKRNSKMYLKTGRACLSEPEGTVWLMQGAAMCTPPLDFWLHWWFLFPPRLTFCVEDLENTRIAPGQELWFHKCRDGWGMKNETR